MIVTLVSRVAAALTMSALFFGIATYVPNASGTGFGLAGFGSTARAATEECTYKDLKARVACIDALHPYDPKGVCAYKDAIAREACIRSRGPAISSTECAYKDPKAREACLASRHGGVSTGDCEYKTVAARDACLKSRKH